MEDLCFVWLVVWYVKSNVILLVCERVVCGVGVGQMSWIDLVSIVIYKVGLFVIGLVMGSDVFFLFVDLIDLVAKVGVMVII